MDGSKTAGETGAGSRIALIAIHGVADQVPGQTARSIASLLVNFRSAAGAYGQGVCDSIMISAQPLEPMKPAEPAVPASPVQKAFKQALRSDFQRADWTAATPATPQAPAPAPIPHDLGIAFSDYLLFKARRNGAESESYEAARIQLARDSNGGPQRVDVFEMYWADLSRLSGLVPRIVTEVFTMLFRFSRLGRDTVDKTAHSLRKANSQEAHWWERLAWWQMMLDGALALVLSNLVLQLLLLGAVIAGLGNIVPYTAGAAMVVTCSVPLLGLVRYCYRHARRPLGYLLALLAAAAAAWALYRAPQHLVVGASWLLILGWCCDYGLRIAEERVPAARSYGLVCLAGTTFGMIAYVAAGMLQGDGPVDLHLWVLAAIRMVEYVLALILVWWFIVPFALLAWLVVGQWAAGAGGASRTSVATGRLGLFISLSFFVVIWMALWALLTTAVESGAQGLLYQPVVFGEQAMAADQFLNERYRRSTESFIVVAGLSVCMLVYMVLMMLPSVLAEVRKAPGTAHNLGRWLSAGYRHLDRYVAALVSIGTLAACVVAIVLGFARTGMAFPTWLKGFSETTAGVSQELLAPLVISAASITAILSIFGAYLSRYVPWLRMPLDVALDVDNYFREFPRKAIPRARIFARYVALLETIAAQGYERIVIVAHSQGTVITAELLRYMQYRAQQKGDRIADLWARLEGKIDLVTAGCPLRQLYAARFPDSYAWICPDESQGEGPMAADIGVKRWVNLYATGDYVGRWLWPGRGTDLYQAHVGTASMAGRELDVCLGSGAHTQYFDQDQAEVAKWIDAILRTRHGHPAAAPSCMPGPRPAQGDLPPPS